MQRIVFSVKGGQSQLMRPVTAALTLGVVEVRTRVWRRVVFILIQRGREFTAMKGARWRRRLANKE